MRGGEGSYTHVAVVVALSPGRSHILTHEINQAVPTFSMLLTEYHNRLFPHLQCHTQGNPPPPKKNIDYKFGALKIHGGRESTRHNTTHDEKCVHVHACL